MVRRVLIANRGEIAVRVIQACRELGIGSVAACTDAERDGVAAGLADATTPVASYLDAEALVEAARAAGADAVHPGYGFLSEDAAFAEAVERAGIVWVGPPPAAMRVLGDKERARALAASIGVPTAPGATGDDAALVEAGRELGAPLLVKAAAGGGGRGMRMVESLDELPAAIASARREAEAAFGDGRVFLERLLTGARHVEVQLLADAHGNVLHLGERDCTLQRRHQKVLEESPSPAVSAELRAALGAAAVALARDAGYRGAGTAEFLLLPDGTFSFLEVNTRLQVEHPVTEAVTGLDLVVAQLQIASGDRLPWTQSEISLRGHAIEARIYAEDPANGFLPTGGRVARLDLPVWPGVRVDTALREGDQVGLSFDPLLAKVTAHAENRDACLRKLCAALAATHVVGVRTNLGFLLEILGHPDVEAGAIDTGWVDRVWQGEAPALPEGIAEAAADARDPWRAFGTARAATEDVAIAGGWAQYRGWGYPIGEGELAATALAPPGGSLTAPMPATVLDVPVSPGDHVGEGTVVALLEAMKIQVTVRAPTTGTVAAVHVKAGDVVPAGHVLVEFAEGGA